MQLRLGRREWVTGFAGRFALRSTLFFCTLIAMVLVAVLAIDSGDGFARTDESTTTFWAVLTIVYFTLLFVVAGVVITVVAMAVAHVLITIPAVARVRHRFVAAFAATIAVLPAIIVPFAYRPRATLTLCVVFAAGNCVIAFWVARSLPPFPAQKLPAPPTAGR